MAKTIKFNLILDNIPVRDLNGVREHFVIEDILLYYSNGLLHRWLDVRGFHSELAAVNSIPSDANALTVITALIKIFEVEHNPEKIREGITILSYTATHRLLDLEYKQNQTDRKQIIAEYHAAYTALIEHMKENKDDFSILKADAQEMENHYYDLFSLDSRRLYFHLVTRAPKAVFALLTRPWFRLHWIAESAIPEVQGNIRTYLLDSTKPDKLASILGNDLKIEKRNTEGMWDPIVPQGTKVMVLAISSNSFVKNHANFSEKIDSETANQNLLLFDGLDFQCNTSAKTVLYLEV